MTPERDDHDVREEFRSAAAIAHLAIDAAAATAPVAAVYLHHKMADGKNEPKNESAPAEQAPETEPPPE